MMMLLNMVLGAAVLVLAAGTIMLMISPMSTSDALSELDASDRKQVMDAVYAKDWDKALDEYRKATGCGYLEAKGIIGQFEDLNRVAS